MDFTLTDEQQAVKELAARMLAEHSEPDRLAALEADGWFDQDLWQRLAEAGLLGIAVAEEHGGAGMTWLELHVLLEEIGRTLAHVPVWETALAATALEASGTRCEVLADVCAGQTVLTLALQEDGAPPERPATRAEQAGDGWHLSGTKLLVPCADHADLLVVSAAQSDGTTGLFLVERSDIQLTSHSLSTDVPHAQVRLDAAPAVALGPVDGTALPLLLQRATAGLASLQAGVCDRALELAGTYTTEREQFGRPIATFQAVSQRLADAYIETECLRLTALQVAWRLSEGLPVAAETDIAAFWAAEAGHRVLHAAHHVHGGIGVDRDYPLYRYLMRAKQYEFSLGSASDHLAALGAALAADPA